MKTQNVSNRKKINRKCWLELEMCSYATLKFIKNLSLELKKQFIQIIISREKVVFSCLRFENVVLV